MIRTRRETMASTLLTYSRRETIWKTTSKMTLEWEVLTTAPITTVTSSNLTPGSEEARGIRSLKEAQAQYIKVSKADTDPSRTRIQMRSQVFQILVKMAIKAPASERVPALALVDEQDL